MRQNDSELKRNDTGMKWNEQEWYRNKYYTGVRRNDTRIKKSLLKSQKAHQAGAYLRFQ